MDRKTPAKLSEELARLGYTWEYLDKWQPKVDMYWHVDQVNVAGEVVGRAGAKLPNLPGHPDHQARYARRGLLPWPPGETCECKGCRERYGTERTGRKFLAPDEVEREVASGRLFGDGGEDRPQTD